MHNFTWDCFCQWIEKMENSKRLIDRLRLDCMVSYVHGLHSDRRKRNILNDFRFRNTTVWSEEEKKEANAVFSGLSSRKQFGNHQLDDSEMDPNQTVARDFKDKDVNNFNATIAHCSKLQRTIKNLFGQRIKPSQRSHNKDLSGNVLANGSHIDILKLNPARGEQNNIERKQHELKTAVLPEIVTVSEDQESSTTAGQAFSKKKI